MSTMGGGAIEGCAKREDDEEGLIRQEELVNDTINYLLKMGVKSNE